MKVQLVLSFAFVSRPPFLFSASVHIWQTAQLLGGFWGRRLGIAPWPTNIHSSFWGKPQPALSQSGDTKRGRQTRAFTRTLGTRNLARRRWRERRGRGLVTRLGEAESPNCAKGSPMLRGTVSRFLAFGLSAPPRLEIVPWEANCFESGYPWNILHPTFNSLFPAGDAFRTILVPTVS